MVHKLVDHKLVYRVENPSKYLSFTIIERVWRIITEENRLYLAITQKNSDLWLIIAHFRNMHCAGGNEKPPFFPFEAEIVVFVLIVH